MRFLSPIRSAFSAERQCFCSVAMVVALSVIVVIEFGIARGVVAQQPPVEAESPPQSIEEDDRFSRVVRPFVENYCLDCHSGEDGEGGVDLDRFYTVGEAAEELELWSKVREVIELKEMPPQISPSEELEFGYKMQSWK